MRAGSAGLDLLGGLGGLDLGGMSAPGPPPQAQPAPAAFADPFGAPAPASFAAPPAASQPPPLPVLLPADKGKGLALSGRLARANGGPGAAPQMEQSGRCPLHFGNACVGAAI